MKIRRSGSFVIAKFNSLYLDEDLTICIFLLLYSGEKKGKFCAYSDALVEEKQLETLLLFHNNKNIVTLSNATNLGEFWVEKEISVCTVLHS